jgi:hypothetical protein
VLDGLTDVPLAAEKDSVASGRGTERELIQGQSLTAGSGDALAGRGGESESGDRELGDDGETLVVEDRADNDDGLGVVGVGAVSLLDDSGEGDRRAVDLWSQPKVRLVFELDKHTLDMNSRRRMTRLNLESVRRARKR